MSVPPQAVLLGGTSWGTLQFWKSKSDTWSGMFFVWGYIFFVFLDFTKDFSIKLEAKKGLYRQGISQIKILGPAILVWEHIILLLFKTSIFQTKVILMIGQIRAFQQHCRMSSNFDWLLFTFEWGRKTQEENKDTKNPKITFLPSAGAQRKVKRTAMVNTATMVEKGQLSRGLFACLRNYTGARCHSHAIIWTPIMAIVGHADKENFCFGQLKTGLWPRVMSVSCVASLMANLTD